MFKKKQTATDPSDNCLPCKEDSCSSIVTTEEVYDSSLAERLTELEEAVSELEFIDLTDTPDNYTGQAGNLVIVNPTATGLIFSDMSVIGKGLEQWSQYKTYTKGEAVLYEESEGNYVIYVAKQGSLALNPTTNPLYWGITPYDVVRDPDLVYFPDEDDFPDFN